MIHTKILTVANRKGGAGKSTCAANISVQAARAGLNVILIDLDPQKTLEKWWKGREEENPSLADITASELGIKIEAIKSKNFDLCIIDTPGDNSMNAKAGVSAADLVLIPTKPTSPDLSAIGRTLGLVEEYNKPYIFLLTQTIARSNIALEAASVLSQFGEIAPSSIGNRVSYVTAMGNGSSAAKTDKNAKEEISAIWKYIYTKLFEIKEIKNDREKRKEKI